MDKQTILTKVNEICDTHKYNLDDSFRDKFSEKFANRISEDVKEINDEMVGSLEFNLETSFSAMSKGLAKESAKWKAEKKALEGKITELSVPNQKDEKVEKTTEIPEEIKKQLEQLQEWQKEKEQSARLQNIANLAKKDIREDLQSNFDTFMKIVQPDFEQTDEEIAKKIYADFSSVFNGSISGNIKPLSPENKVKELDNLLNSVSKVKI